MKCELGSQRQKRSGGWLKSAQKNSYHTYEVAQPTSPPRLPPITVQLSQLLTASCLGTSWLSKAYMQMASHIVFTTESTVSTVKTATRRAKHVENKDTATSFNLTETTAHDAQYEEIRRRRTGALHLGWHLRTVLYSALLTAYPTQVHSITQSFWWGDMELLAG
jgi:hypothetical protein